MTLNKQQKRDLKGLVLGFFVFVVVAIIYSQNGFRQLEWLADDFKTQLLRSDARADDQVIVLLVDEASLSSMEEIVGRWPWPRSVWADVLEYMSMGGAKSVAYDILFTERSAGSMQGGESEHDGALIEASADSGIATHAMQLLHDPSNPDKNRPLPSIFPEKFALNDVSGIPETQNDTFYIPFQGLYQSAAHMAVVEFSPDEDGDYRRTNLFRDYHGAYYPVLSTASLMQPLNIQKVVQDSAQHLMYIDDIAIPLDRDNHYQVNFYKHFESFSIATVLASVSQLRQGNTEVLYTDPRLVSPEVFQNKIVLIGTSAVGLEDMKSTPINARWPGVFLHASIVSNILKRDFIYPVKIQWVYVAILLSALLTTMVVLAHGSLLLQVIYPAALAGLYVGGNISIQHYFALQLDMVAPVATIFITWLVIGGYLSATEGREKRRVRAMLAQYVSPAALNSVLDNYEDQIQAEIGKEEEMSVVFSDIRGFTTISEGLSPAEVVKLLNIHLDAMTTVTFDHGGTMDKFIGDATMAFWGAPLPDAEHALHATQAAIHMHRALSEVNATLATHGINPINIGVGVNTGRVILGNIGSSQKLDYTVIGDAVNLGSRLEGLTKPYGVGVLVSEFTQAFIKDRIPCALIDMVRVKGKNEPVKIYAPIADMTDEDIEYKWQLVTQCAQGFELYHHREFEKAKVLFNQLPDDPFATFKAIYLERCDAYLLEPPADDWDGVFTLTSK